MARHCFRSVLIKWPCLLRYTLTKEPDVKDNNKTLVNLFSVTLKKSENDPIYRNIRRKYGAFHRVLCNEAPQNQANGALTAPKWQWLNFRCCIVYQP